MTDRYQAIYAIVAANQPTGARFTYYTATSHGIVPKTVDGYRKVQRAILKMRREGVIAWSWIVDSNRWMRKPSTYGSVEEALRSTAEFYRRALRRDAETVVEVWCESESVAGVLYPITAEWDVPLYPIKGQTSDSFAWGAAQQYRDDDRDLLILYVGDHDPAGYEIETNLRRKLTEFAEREIAWRRLACTADDVDDLGLSGTAPKKASYRDALTGELVRWSGPAVEIEAIDPPLLRRRLDQEIESYVDKHELGVIRLAEESEREVLRAMARGG